MIQFGMFEYSLLVWIVNAALALVSYFWCPPEGVLVAMFPAIFIAFGMMLRFSRKDGIGPAQVWKDSATWAKVIAIVSILYTAVNFPLCMTLLGEGGPHIEDGVYCLWNHGFIREITVLEYEALRKVEFRMFFGHMLAFSAVPVAFFSARKNICLL